MSEPAAGATGLDGPGRQAGAKSGALDGTGRQAGAPAPGPAAPVPEPVEGTPLAPADRALADALALALTGQGVATSPAGASPQQLADGLAAAGWDSERLQQLRHERQELEQPWPFTVERGLLATAGFARYQASLKELRRLLGLDGLVPARHVGPKVIGPVERRLLADVPPHHGNVG